VKFRIIFTTEKSLSAAQGAADFTKKSHRSHRHCTSIHIIDQS